MAENIDTERDPSEGQNSDQLFDGALLTQEGIEMAESQATLEFVLSARDYFRNKYAKEIAWAEKRGGDLKDWVKRETQVTPEGMEKAAKNILEVRDNIRNILPGVIFKIIGGVYEFIKTIIKKKGHISFGEGYDIGQEMFNFSAKKEKK
jgi:hypothetical protein